MLGLWCLGLVAASVQLERWQSQMTRTLVQLSADSQFRSRATDRNQVDPEWYRRKALALLGAMEQLHGGTLWTAFMPGSWAVFDDLEQRLAARMEREFGDIVLETIRRELHLRASELTGAPIGNDGRIRSPLECAAPLPLKARRLSGGTTQDLAELVALRDYVEALRPLDRALQSWQVLQQDGAADGPGHLRHLVHYTLGADLPATSSRAVMLFGTQRRGSESVRRWDPTPASIRAAARCTLERGASALYTRLLSQHPLLELERSLARESDGLFEARKRMPFAPTVRRLQAVHDLLQRQEALLARGDMDWMQHGADGPDRSLLSRIADLPLLGPEVVQAVQVQRAAALAEFRLQFEALVDDQEQPGLVWSESRQHFAFSPERDRLRLALGRLLANPSMRLQDDGAPPAATPGFQAAFATGDTRRLLGREVLEQLPAFARPALARLVDDRLALLAHDSAVLAIRASLPAHATLALDARALKAQQQQVMQVQKLLMSFGAPDLAHRLSTQQAAELGARLSAAQGQLRRLPLFAPQASDYTWWRGEPAPLLRSLGTRDATTLKAALADQQRRLAIMTDQAQAYIVAAGGALAGNTAAQAWMQLAAELRRRRAGLPDSSLAVTERYLLAVGPDLKRDNCAETLKAQRPPTHVDPVAARLFEVHNALLQRCLELRVDRRSP
ncbi:hypothetical protein [Ramlibacter sp.]|uniref:hypothetical protein n=1 Tax=Ramlibacter sp. TaxID=1917967 RepID=UPI002D78849D|nr:hypothetical protein [Ramlibacter sp.]